MKQVDSILEKYNHFRGARIDSIHSSSDSSKVVTFVIYDDDGEEINRVKIEFTDIKAGRILQNSVLSFLDMMGGVSIIKENDLYGFALGSGTAMLHVHSAPLYIVASGISIEES